MGPRVRIPHHLGKIECEVSVGMALPSSRGVRLREAEDVDGTGKGVFAAVPTVGLHTVNDTVQLCRIPCSLLKGRIMIGAQRRALLRRVGLTAAATMTVLAVAAQAWAEPTVIELEKGDACADFPVTVVINDDSKRRTRTFVDQDGNTVTVKTGRAESVLVINAETGETVTVPSRGARTKTTTFADGSSTTTQTGNRLLVLFENDPGGSGLTSTSTTLIAGRTVFTGAFEVTSLSGRITDLCRTLAP